MYMEGGETLYMANKLIILSKKILKVSGYVLFIAGVIELMVNIFGFKYGWLYVVEHLTIGAALLIEAYIDNEKIVCYIAFPLSIIGFLCILVRFFI